MVAKEFQQSNSGQLVRHGMSPGEIGVAVDCGAKVWQADAAGAAVFAGAVANHLETDREDLRHLSEAAFAVAEAAGVAVV